VCHKMFVEELYLPGLQSINRNSTRCHKARPSKINIGLCRATNSVRGSSCGGDTSFINLVHAISSHVQKRCLKGCSIARMLLFFIPFHSRLAFKNSTDGDAAAEYTGQWQWLQRSECQFQRSVTFPRDISQQNRCAMFGHPKEGALEAGQFLHHAACP
jgi:hypothetical protein